MTDECFGAPVDDHRRDLQRSSSGGTDHGAGISPSENGADDAVEGRDLADFEAVTRSERNHDSNETRTSDLGSAENALKRSDLAVLDAILGHEISKNTKRSYETQWRLFVDWARSKGVPALPADPVHVAVYLAERMELHGHKPATLRSAASAVSYAHKTADLNDPCASQEVKNALKSAARKAGREQRQAEALTAEEMQKIRGRARLPRYRRGGGMENVEAAERRGLADIAMISLMRDAMLRVSEAATLQWDDLRTASDGTGRLLIKRSKTDAEGETALLFVSRPTMADLEAMRGAAPEGDSMFGLSASQINRRIKSVALAAGLGEGFSGHSPRVGMAQDLARSGTELPRLMTAGRWRSPRMPAHYIRNETAARGAVAQYYGAAPDFAAGESQENDRNSCNRDGTRRDGLQPSDDSFNIERGGNAEDGAEIVRNHANRSIKATISEFSSKSQNEAETHRGNSNRNPSLVPFRKKQEGFEKNRTFIEGSDQILAQRRKRRLLPSLRLICGDVSSHLRSIRPSKTRGWRRLLTNAVQTLNLELQQHRRTDNLPIRSTTVTFGQSSPAIGGTATLGLTGITGQRRRREIRPARRMTVASPGRPFGDHELLDPSLRSEAPGTFTVSWDEVIPKPSEYRVNWAKSREPFPHFTQSEGNAYPVENGLTVMGLVPGETYKVRVRKRYIRPAGQNAVRGPWSGAGQVVVMGDKQTAVR